METRGIFTFLLLATIISLQMGGGCSLIFENHVPKESAIPLDASQLNKKADLLSPNKLMSKEDRMARFLNQFRFKKGGRAALVDLLDYMNKPKLRKEDMASTSTVRDPAQVKPWSWEAMLYEEN